MQRFFSTLPYLRTLQQLGSIACAALLFVACGGGGGGGDTPPAASATISGTAAGGAPVVGVVEVRDNSANTQPVRGPIPIEANGHYSVDVSGLQPPLAFLATGTVGGKRVSLYSMAMQADVGSTINITPFTDLIIRNIAAGAVDAYINNGTFTNLMPAELDAQRDALTDQLGLALTAMGLSPSIDFLRTVFNADSTGLDRFMDVVKVSPTPTGATITNILDAANQLILDTTGAPTSPPLGTGGLFPTGTPVDQILQTFTTFSSLFATGLPSPTDPSLLALVSSTFLDSGEDRSAFLTEITTDSNLIGLKFSYVVVDTVDDVAGTAQVHVTPRDAAGVILDHNNANGSMLLHMVKPAGVWQVDGDRRIADVTIQTQTTRHICNVGSPTNCVPGTTFTSGLDLAINNVGLQPIGSALVTGPGLPAQGVTLTAQADVTWFAFSISSPTCPGCTTNTFEMTDTQIQAVLPNSSYTVQLFSNAPTPTLMATYTEVVPVAPVLNPALPTSAYPSITSSTQNLAGITNATLTPSWNIPPGLWGDEIQVSVFQGPGPSLHIQADLPNSTATSGTSTIVITAPPTGGSWTDGFYWIQAGDQYGGKLATGYQ